MQGVVFALVCAAFTTIYITQPVLPGLRQEFGVDAATASHTIAAVVLGIALANLPFGLLSDRYPVRPIILTGGMVVGCCSLLCALSQSLSLLIAARFIQGLFIPSLTTCLAAYLTRVLPVESLNVVMGSYVSATVAGGLGGRLLGGWIHPPVHRRNARPQELPNRAAIIRPCSLPQHLAEGRSTDERQASSIWPSRASAFILGYTLTSRDRAGLLSALEELLRRWSQTDPYSREDLSQGRQSP